MHRGVVDDDNGSRDIPGYSGEEDAAVDDGQNDAFRQVPIPAAKVTLQVDGDVKSRRVFPRP